MDTDHTSEHTYSECLESVFLASLLPMGDFQSHLLSLSRSSSPHETVSPLPRQLSLSLYCLLEKNCSQLLLFGFCFVETGRCHRAQAGGLELTYSNS